MRESETVRDKVLRLFDKNSWIQFLYEELLPAYTSEEKRRNAELAELSRHCVICRNINGCCFLKTISRIIRCIRIVIAF